MHKQLILEIEFKASKTDVWKLLTDGSMTQQYMFGSDVQSDWKIGSSIIWKGKTEDGNEIVFVKGEIEEIIPGEKVTYSMFDPNRGLEDKPENYLHLTYELFELENSIRFQLTQGDFSKVENGENRYKESLGGWETIFPIMKQLVE